MLGHQGVVQDSVSRVYPEFLVDIQKHRSFYLACILYYSSGHCWHMGTPKASGDVKTASADRDLRCSGSRPFAVADGKERYIRAQAGIDQLVSG